MAILDPRTAPVFVSVYELVARDAAALALYYKEVIGLQIIEERPTRYLLGIDTTPLLVIHSGPGARISTTREAGLFHTAFLVPHRADLAHVLQHALETSVPLGAADHIVSEALYFTDPEGNGIEIYADRPTEMWPYVDTTIQMETLPLSTKDLLASAPDTAWERLPPETTIGHIHLRTNTLAISNAFYHDDLGLDSTQQIQGAEFFSSGGYHHHVAANTWLSEGGAMRDNTSTGLHSYTFTFNDNVLLRNTITACETKGLVTEKNTTEATLVDPSGITILLTSR